MFQWRKSSHSEGGGVGECVEVAGVANTVLIRDSKDPNGPRLVFTRGHLRELISGVKVGRYDTEL